MKTKKRIIGIIIVLVIFAVAISMTASAASYPMVTVEHSIYTVEQGETAEFLFTVYPAYVNEVLYENIYEGSSVDYDKQVGYCECPYYNTTDDPFYQTITWDTTDAAPGLYTVEYYMEYYSGEYWYEASYDTFQVNVLPVTLDTPKLSSVSNATNGVTVKWGAVNKATYYRVFRKSSGSGWTMLTDTTGTSYTDKTAKSGTTYTYTVRCVDAHGNYTSSFDSKGKTIKYIAAPTISVSNTTTGVQVKWNAVSGAAKYRVFKKVSGKWTTLADTTSTSFADTSVKSGSSYTYTVRCISSDGNTYTSNFNSTGKTIKFLSAPTISGLTNTSTGVQIKWGTVTGAEKYRVFKKVSGAWTALADTTSTSYVDKSAKTGTSSTYTVRCINAAGTSYTSAFNTAGKTIKYMATPSLSVSNLASGVQVKWNSVNGAAKYRVFKKISGKWTAIGDTAATSFVDTAVTSGTSYTYTVRCITSDGSAYTSNFDSAGKTITFVAAATLADPSVSVANTTNGVQVKWDAIQGAEKYRVFKKVSGKWTALGDTYSTSFTDATAVSGNSYTYTVRCISADGKSYTSSFDSTGKTIRYIAAPSFDVTSTKKGVEIKWSAVNGAEKYRVFKKISGKWTTLGDTADTSFVDTAAVEGESYTYTVRCINAAGSSYTSAYNTTGKTIIYEKPEGKAYPHCKEDGTIDFDKIAYYDDEYDYTQNEKFKVCYIAQQGSPLYAMSAAAYEHWAPFFNCEWIPFMNAEGDSDKYMTLLQTQLDAGVRGFVLDPDSTIFAAVADLMAEYPEAGWMSQMSAPRDNEVGDGIPAGGNLLNNYIGFDNYDAGAQQAYKLIEWKNDNYPYVDWSDVGVIVYDYSTSPALHLRAIAAEDVLFEVGVPELWEADCVADGLTVQAGINWAASIIPYYTEKEIWLVASMIDDWAQGAASVIETCGLTDKSCCVAFGGSGLIAQFDGGQFDSFRYALFTPQLLMGEPILGSVYAYLMGWATPDTIYPSWVNYWDCGTNGHTYSNVLLPTVWLSADNYKHYLEWCDLYAHANEFPYDDEVWVDIHDYTAYAEPTGDFAW